MSEYNGWTNKETWLVNVWFNPESQADVAYAKDSLEEQVDALGAGCLQDMINLGEINWDELNDHFDDVQECDICSGLCEGVKTMGDSHNSEWEVCPNCVTEFENEY